MKERKGRKEGRKERGEQFSLSNCTHPGQYTQTDTYREKGLIYNDRGSLKDPTSRKP